MGSIFARGSQLYMKYKTVAGAWKQRPTGYAVGHEKEAEKFLTQLEGQIAAAIALGEREEGPLTVRRYHERWSERRRAKGVASAKDDEARVPLHVLPAIVDRTTGQVFGDLVLDEVKPRHAREVVDALVVKMKAGDLAPRSVRHAFFVVRTMFEHAVTLDERLASNPCVLPKGYLPGKQDKDPTWRPSAKFTHAEVEQLIEDGRVPEDWRAIHATLFLSGARFGELAALTLADYDPSLKPLGKLTLSKSYDFKGKRLKSTKTGRAREVPVHATLAEILDAWINGGWQRFMGRKPQPSDLLFPSGKPHLTHGQFRNNNLALKQFHRYCEQLGIRTRRIHDSRRTFISLARDDGAQRDVIKSLTHPLDDSDAHDSYTTFAWSRCCEEVAKLKIGLRKASQPAAASTPAQTDAATAIEAWTPESGWFSTENAAADDEFGAVLGAVETPDKTKARNLSAPGLSSLRPEPKAFETMNLQNETSILDVFQFRSRGDELVVGTIDPLVPRPARVAQDLALAIQLQAEIDSEQLTYRELAERHGWSRMKACRLLPLARLAPDLQAEVSRLTTTVAGEPLDRDTLVWVAQAPDWETQRSRFRVLEKTWSELAEPLDGVQTQ